MTLSTVESSPEVILLQTTSESGRDKDMWWGERTLEEIDEIYVYGLR